MTVFFLILSSFYIFLLIRLSRSWETMVKKEPTVKATGNNCISIIIPVRNEATNIQRLLKSIAVQSFPVTNFEVIIVDDHSEDETISAISTIEKEVPFKITLLELSDVAIPVYGKKQALQLGIEKAKGNIIVTTDGDCIVEEFWLESINNYFEGENAQMLIGPVAFYGEETAFEIMQSLEMAALIGVGAVSLHAGFPNMCNGANLAFTKKAFYEARGYLGNMEIASGDDEFLLQKVYTLYPKQVFFNTSINGIVYTKAIPDLPTFVSQRKRWSGKWRQHKAVSIKSLAFFIFLYHATFLVFFVLTISGQISPWYFVVPAGLKAVFEFIFIKKVLTHFKKKLSIKHFVVLQCIYSFYVLIFGVIANFGSFDWKGRKY